MSKYPWNFFPSASSCVQAMKFVIALDKARNNQPVDSQVFSGIDVVHGQGAAEGGLPKEQFPEFLVNGGRNHRRKGLCCGGVRESGRGRQVCPGYV